MQKIENQIKAIQKTIEQGKCKNVYAAINKIKALNNKLEQIKYFNFLAK